jgi:hypothetical protein
LSQNMFANTAARRPLTRATLGIGLAMAAIGAIGFGTGVAGAAPQQPLLVDDPVPAPTPVATNPNSAVNIANAIFSELGSVLNAVLPGSGSIFMPADTGTNPLSPGSGTPSMVSPGQTPALPGYPGTLPPGDPSSVVPGQVPTLPGYPAVPGQAPVVPGSPAVPLVPGQTPALPTQPSLVPPADNVPIV